MKAVHDAIASLLATDATFVAAMQALNLGTTGADSTPGVKRGNQPLGSLGQEHFPSWFIEAGDAVAAAVVDGGDPAGLYIGDARQSFVVDIPLALVWHQQDRETAHAQRLGLLSPLAKLIARNPTLGGAAVNAWVASANNDRQAAHPLHVAQFVISATFEEID